MISEVKNILDSFNSIRLEEMDNVRLMDRFDTKYLLPANRVPDLLQMMQPGYRVLEIDKFRISSYTTIYLDTPDFAFFRQHVTGRTGRIKVRFRSYHSTGITFLEIKKKTKKNRTVKWRIENSFSGSCCNESALEFITRHVPVNTAEVLNPVLTNRFNRITLVGFNIPERVTIDMDLYYTGSGGKTAGLPLVAIVELKSEGFAARSSFSRIIRQLSVYPTAFSKYCIGNALLYDLPLTNILKPKLLLLNRIENEYNGSLSA
jgi:hypothetical protein